MLIISFPISSLAASQSGSFITGGTVTFQLTANFSTGFNVSNLTGTIKTYNSDGTLAMSSPKSAFTGYVNVGTATPKIEITADDSLGTYTYDDTELSATTSGTTLPPADPGDGDTNTTEPIGGLNMFANLTTTAITTEATSWANHFDSLLLVVVGVGIGFACVRFVKSMFF